MMNNTSVVMPNLVRHLFYYVLSGDVKQVQHDVAACFCFAFAFLFYTRFSLLKFNLRFNKFPLGLLFIL